MGHYLAADIVSELSCNLLTSSMHITAVHPDVYVSEVCNIELMPYFTSLLDLKQSINQSINFTSVPWHVLTISVDKKEIRAKRLND